jgi:hypothetical protein
LRDLLVGSLRVRLVLPVAVVDVPLGVLVKLFEVVSDGFDDYASPFLEGRSSDSLDEASVASGLQSAVTHLIEEVSGLLFVVGCLQIFGGRIVGQVDRLGLVPLLIEHNDLAPFLTNGDIPPKHLVLIIPDELLESAPLIVTVQDHRGRTVIRVDQLEVHAVQRLHGRGLRLANAIRTSLPVRVVVLNFVC